eukprot:SAG11_NODE_3217_length_2604_cov_1.697006_3_plen_49_part_00
MAQLSALFSVDDSVQDNAGRMLLVVAASAPVASVAYVLDGIFLGASGM